MSRGWRAFFGAAIGAILVLLIHPVSRPFLLTSLTRWGGSSTLYNSDLILENRSYLPGPTNLVEASLWMEAGADQENSMLDPKQLMTLIGVASYAAKQDPDNAYWNQMKAVFYHVLAMNRLLTAKERGTYRTNTLEEWRKGANLSRWDDYQTRRLETIQKNLAAEAGSSAAWQFAAVYPLREIGAATRIKMLAQDLLRDVDLSSREGLLIRYQTLMNGKLMRDGSRYVKIGRLGSDLVELASFPKVLPAGSVPRKMVFSRIEFFNNLWKAGLRDQAFAAHAAFNSNDGWVALTDEQDFDLKNRQLRASSLVTIGFPGAMLAISVIGGMIWGLSCLMRARPELLKVVEPPLAPAIGIVLAFAVYHGTGLLLASVAIVACFGFLAFTPVRERSRAPEQMGPVFEMTVFALSCVLAALLVCFFIGLSTPGCEVLPALGVTKDFYGGSTLLLGLSGIVMGLLLLAAPSWALVQRMATPFVVVLGLRQFGRGLFLGCLALAIIATPVCVVTDKFFQAELGKIVGNEPLYYQISR